jgi:polar amino acid transport system substrate-binding protein
MGRLHLSRRIFLFAAAATGIGALPRDARAGVLKVASEDYPPYAFSFRGQRKGYDVEKITMILEALRYRPVQHSMVRSAMFQGLDEGTVDLAFPFTQTPVRLQKYLLVGPLHTNRTVLAVRTDDAKEPVGLEALAGLRVGVTDRHRYPPEFDALQNITRVSCSSLNLAIRRLSYGRVDAVVGDRSAMEAIAYEEGLENQVHVSPNVIAAGPAYILLPKSHTALAAAVGDVLHRLDAAGKFAELATRYPSVEPPR